jgi:hypothetical protein
MLNFMTFEDLMDSWARVRTTAAPVYGECEEAIIRYNKERLKRGAEKLVDEAPDSINSMLKSAIGNMAEMALEVNYPENEGDDAVKTINVKAAEIEKQLDEMYNYITDSAVSTTYGGVMDEFTTAAEYCRSEIQSYLNDESLTPNERAVKVAELLKEKNMMSLMERSTAAMTDMFRDAYDLYSKDSMFIGEALDKSQSYILKRVNTYLQNYLVVLELLKAQQRVTEFTPEDVEELGEDCSAIYDKMDCTQLQAKKAVIDHFSQLIKSNEANEKAKKKNNREGIFNKLKDYFSQDRFVYINRGKANVPVNQKLFAASGSNFVFGGPENPALRLNLLNECHVLTSADIGNIANHAKEEGQTITEYLEKIGFNTNSVCYTGKAPLLLDGNFDEGLFGRGLTKCSTKYAKVGGYRMESKSDYTRTDRNLIKCIKTLFDGSSTEGGYRRRIDDKMGLYLVAFVGRDFTDPFAI